MLRVLDQVLTDPAPRVGLAGVRRFGVEFLWFGLKQARACLFAGAFFLAIFFVPRDGIAGLPRYDVLLGVALLIQAGMLLFRIETLDEFKAILLFHVVGFALEAFKTSKGIGSWHYPGPAYTKLLGVPLFAGFMYAAVGNYIIQAWRLFDLRVRYHPPYWMACLAAALVYANFFTSHWLGDYRWYLAALILGLYARTVVIYRPADRDRFMPLTLSFVLIGFFLWIAENFGTLFGVWRYPGQVHGWAVVQLGKWSSWSLLVILTFTIVAGLKHVKDRIHVP